MHHDHDFDPDLLADAGSAPTGPTFGGDADAPAPSPAASAAAMASPADTTAAPCDAPADQPGRPGAPAAAPSAGRRIALCLSGGGYRAALFHLGAVRRLDELGLLARLDAISAVSGGSLLAAHLALAGKAAAAAGAGGFDRLEQGDHGGRGDAPRRVFADFERQVAAPFRAFTRRNVRTPAILRRTLPWNWLADDTGVRGLEAAYDRHLTHGRRLEELPARPRFVFCATDMVFGVSWVFERLRAGGYLPGYTREARSWPLARAVAASSCFPPVFSPLRLHLDPATMRGGMALPRAIDAIEREEITALIGRIGLSDGGVYDNLGLEPVWDSAETLLISDGGATFPWASPRNPFRWLMRYAGVASNQIQALRTRWLAARAAEARRAAAASRAAPPPPGGSVEWLPGDAEAQRRDRSEAAARADHRSHPDPSDSPDHPDHPDQPDHQWAMWRIGHARSDGLGYSAAVARRQIATIRTDLDAFSDAEAAVLENHGYLLADAAIGRRLAGDPHLLPAALAPPHPAWLDPQRAGAGLARSDRRRALGRWRFASVAAATPHADSGSATMPFQPLGTDRTTQADRVEGPGATADRTAPDSAELLPRAAANQPQGPQA